MHFSKIYLQDNFTPDVVQDQFRRKVIGVEITIQEGESLDEAKQTAENYIREYIQANTTFHSPNFEPQPPEPSVLPSIQVKEEKAYSMEDEINSCTEFKVLETYYFFVKDKPELKSIYDIKRKQLVAKESKEIIDKANALCLKH